MNKQAQKHKPRQVVSPGAEETLLYGGCACMSWCNQCHRLLAIIQQWKWQLEIKASVSSCGQCRLADAGLGATEEKQPRTTDAAADDDDDETEEVVARFSYRHQNTEKTRHCLLHSKLPALTAISSI